MRASTILGVVPGGRHAAACLLVDGQLVAGALEADLVPTFNGKRFPGRAVREVLARSSLSLAEVSQVAMVEGSGRRALRFRAAERIRHLAGDLAEACGSWLSQAGPKLHPVPEWRARRAATFAGQRAPDTILAIPNVNREGVRWEWWRAQGTGQMRWTKLRPRRTERPDGTSLGVRDADLAATELEHGFLSLSAGARAPLALAVARVPKTLRAAVGGVVASLGSSAQVSVLDLREGLDLAFGAAAQIAADHRPEDWPGQLPRVPEGRLGLDPGFAACERIGWRLVGGQGGPRVERSGADNLAESVLGLLLAGSRVGWFSGPIELEHSPRGGRLILQAHDARRIGGWRPEAILAHGSRLGASEDLLLRPAQAPLPCVAWHAIPEGARAPVAWRSLPAGLLPVGGHGALNTLVRSFGERADQPWLGVDPMEVAPGVRPAHPERAVEAMELLELDALVLGSVLLHRSRGRSAPQLRSKARVTLRPASRGGADLGASRASKS